MDQMDQSSGLLGLALLLFVYFVPWFVALLRGANGHGGVLVLNLFLGWTILGWIIALAWDLPSGDPS